jgi:uncharacterized protein YbcI
MRPARSVPRRSLRERSDGTSDRESGADPDPQRGEVAAPTADQVADEISRDLLAIHRDSYGRAAASAEAHVLGDTVIVLIDGLELMPNEEFLISNGHGEMVGSVRTQFQQAIGPTFCAAVERATGRRVIGFASHVQIVEEPRFMAEIFRLEPR